MAKTFEFTALTPLPFTNLPDLLDTNSESLAYTSLGLNVTARKFDSNGNATSDYADTAAVLDGYNTTAVPPLALGIVGVDVLVKNGDSSTDSLRATSENDIVYWDYATLFSLSTLSVPVGIAIVSRYNLPSADENAAIEVFDLGAGNDVLNLTHSSGDLLVSGLLVGPQAYAYAATAFGGSGDDILWSGDGNDVLHGEANHDRLDGGAGDDTLYGGSGMDSLAGGPGADLLVDTAGGAIFSGAGGDDVVTLQVSNPSLAMALSTTDEGNDLVTLSGDYASTSFTLGDGDDLFVGSQSTAASVDRVSGGEGVDVISTWSGADEISGDVGNDALWGGAGSDTIYGGDGSDFLYGGAGDGDQLYGGADMDYFFWARTDGAGDQVYDEFRGTATQAQGGNALLVFPGYDGAGILPAQTGVFEVDGVITDNVGGDDMVHAYDLDGAGPGTLWRVEVLQGAGAGNYVDFDQRDILVIGLWDHEAAPGDQVITQYVWNGATYGLAV